MAASEKRRLSFIKYSEKDLKDLGLSTETQTIQEICQPGTSKQGRLSFVKFSQRDLKDFRLLDNTSEKKNTSEPVKESRRIKLQNIFPPPNQKNVTSVYKIRSSRISRRSSISKKEIKKKTVTRINNFLYNTSDRKENTEVRSAKKVLETLEKQCRFGARKELFKIPVANPTNNALSIDWEKSIQGENVHPSPLMDIEKAEILLANKPCLKKNLFKESVFSGSVAVPNLSNVDEISQSLSPSTSGTTLQNTTKNSSSPDLEFEIVEKICEQERKIEYSTEIRQIREILQNDKDELQMFNEAHERRMKAIFEILNVIQKHSKFEAGQAQHLNTDKNYLLTVKDLNTTSTPSKRTPISRKKLSISTTKSTHNLYDLRINLLKSNLTKSGNKSTKEKKAQNMYNDLRKTFCSLETPKFDRSEGKGEKNISLKLQEQCLLLLETPQHK